MASRSPAKAISHEGFHSDEELAVLRAIVAREDALDTLLDCCCAFSDDQSETESASIALLQQILVVRAQSLDVIDRVAAWRRRMVQKCPFTWRNSNYLLKMCSDLDFLARSQLVMAAMDGVRLLKRNPFTTIGGLDQSMRVFWQRDMPDDDDLPVLLDSNSYAKDMGLDEPSRIKLSEWMLLTEERKYGRLPKSETLLDARMRTLIQKEAEAASRKRFGAAT